MSFNIGLSGIRAASQDLNITGNNIANASTVGFKQSRAEFQDLYASSMLGSGRNQTGSGVLLGNVGQLFNQGTIDTTGNALDMGVNGNGFFVTSNNGAIQYTRAGYFGTDKDGFIVDNNGYKLQGYPTSATGQLQDGVRGDLRLETTNQAPKATTTVAQTLNLNSTNTVPVNTPFNADDPTTYNSSTSVNIYDAEGNSHVMSQYFVKDGANSWSMKVLVDGRNPLDGRSTNADGATPLSVDLDFTDKGLLIPNQADNAASGLVSNGDGTFALKGWTPVQSDGKTPATYVANGAAATASIGVDLRGTTQYNSAFAVNSVNQDGYTTGMLSGLEISDTGQIFARYTNGQSKVQGQVVLANFANVQGLTPIGKTSWVESADSGQPVIGTPRSGTLGALQAGSLEASNVDISTELVDLIVAQRNYQANAKTIETENAVTQTIINLR
ncbi:flagellar hook protein FlgE [Pseudomonas matsuisoli]|uniref:Flagellar hook protein FlgE n=1 Tax=Pseudomonas matsuisoli TaxID=1515666 RepID=A0A917PIL1_9PSED|nr:flagellar hook protein FlgE [Pseudomonas matsuisoli]GGJ80571.1 flagellar hook protein FlgE [Pseudomonas matsuisoli]